jgi:hypothetical protein
MSKRGLGSRSAWAGGAAAMVLAFAPGSAGASCIVKVDDPTVHRTRTGDRIIVGAGVRGTDCKEKKILFVRLRHHRRLWPDETVAEMHFTVSNARLPVSYVCRGAGVQTFFTEAWVQGDDKHKSRYKKFDACG